MKQNLSKSKPPYSKGRNSIWIDEDRMERLREIAEREDRSLVSVVRRALDREFELEQAA